MTQQSDADLSELFGGAKRRQGYEEQTPPAGHAPAHGNEDETQDNPAARHAGNPDGATSSPGLPQDSQWGTNGMHQPPWTGTGTSHPPFTTGELSRNASLPENPLHTLGQVTDPHSVGSGPALAGQIVPYDPNQQNDTTKGPLAKLLETLGMGRKQRAAEEMAASGEYERIIRQVTWTRAVNIVVGGGPGIGPAALTVGGLAAQVRGGSCVAFEATASRGHLVDLCEGNPTRGMTELIAGADMVGSAGNLAGYTIPQTSHLAVIGSVDRRAQLTGDQMRSVRKVLDTYNQITVAALDKVLDGPLAQDALKVADAVVIPAVMTKRSLLQAVRSLDDVFRANSQLRGKVVVAVGHSGAPEDEETAAHAVEHLQRYAGDTAVVVETPFEPSFIADRDFSIDGLTRRSRRAWLEVTSAAIHAIDDTPHH